MNRKLVPHHSHWGAFNAVVEAGMVVGAVPFEFDPDPSPLIEAIPDGCIRRFASLARWYE